MKPKLLLAERTALVLAAIGVLGCTSDGGTNPPAITAVVITAPVAPPSFQTVGRTVQFSAEARDGLTAVPGVTITWTTSAPLVASVNGSGLVTATGNGTAEIRATSGSVQSDPTTVTVAQFADATAIAPASVTFGALGSTRQLTATSRDSNNFLIPGSPVVTWTSAGPGTSASVSGTGLVTANAVGTGDTAIATIGGKVAKAPITVTQVAHSVVVASTGNDTLRTTGRQKTFTATVRDTNLNTIPGAGVAWASTTPATATVDGAGVATAVFDGVTNIQATSGAAVGQKQLVVLRFSAIFLLTPSTGAINANGGTFNFAIDARDSVDTVLPTSWLSRNTAVATVAPTLGASTTATATGNGMIFVVVASGTNRDSAQLTVTNQAVLNMTATVTIGDFFFQSVRNNTQNSAIDTIGAGGTVTWNFTGAARHNVESQGAPSFTSSPAASTGNYVRTFPATGTYEYICLFHGNMTGRVVVR